MTDDILERIRHARAGMRDKYQVLGEAAEEIAQLRAAPHHQPENMTEAIDRLRMPLPPKL